MFQIFRRFLCISVHGQNVKPKMGPTRYFLNPMADYSGNENDIPENLDFIKKSIETIVQSIEKSIEPSMFNSKDGLYLGTTGIAYMYYHLSKSPTFKDLKPKLLTKAVQYITPALTVAEKNSIKDIPSFILGSCGTYAVASVLFKAMGDVNKCDKYKNMYQEAANICKIETFLNCGSDELFVGRAGYIFGVLWLSSESDTSLSKNDIHHLCQITLKSGSNYADHHKSACPLMYSYYDTEYLGAAHGLCAILQALISVPGFLSTNPRQVNKIKTSVDYLLSLQDKEGNFPCTTSEIGRPNPLVHWCHGAGGMIYLMAKAYLVWKDQKYLQSCEKMGDLIWGKGLLKKGPGICHGIAGNGYAFLLLYRLTYNHKYLYRAISFAKFMETDEFIKEARTPDYPFSLYEGLAGTVCFLTDVLRPQGAAFPFSDVF